MQQLLLIHRQFLLAQSAHQLNFLHGLKTSCIWMGSNYWFNYLFHKFRKFSLAWDTSTTIPNSFIFIVVFYFCYTSVFIALCSCSKIIFFIPSKWGMSKTYDKKYPANLKFFFIALSPSIPIRTFNSFKAYYSLVKISWVLLYYINHFA